jgi:penicillin-binding protein 1A
VRSLNGMLREAMRRGTAERAAFDRRAAGKTGTSQDSRDAWFAGYTGELVGVIWVGQDANRPMRGVTGGSLPAEQWRHLMANIHSDRRPRPPPGVDD